MIAILALIGGSLAHAEDCTEGATIVVRFADRVSAPAYRPAVRAALANLERPDGCPVFAPDGGVLDWVEVDALARKEGETRELFRTLQGVASADAETRRDMAAAIRSHTSGYGDATLAYLSRFSRAQSHLTVTQARGEGWSNVYLELRQAQQLLPRTSAFTFDDATPAEREDRVTAAVLDLFPDSNRAPGLSLIAQQDTGFGTIEHTAEAWDPAADEPEIAVAMRVQGGAPVAFDASGTTDPESAATSLSYAWTVDGRAVRPEAPTVLEHAFAGPGPHLVTLEVSDGAHRRRAQVQVAVAEEVRLRSTTAAVQVLGLWRGADVPLRFSVDAGEDRRPFSRLRYRWTQVEGPSLTCADVVSSDATCEDTAGFAVVTERPELQVGSTVPGLHRFEAIEVADGVASAAVEVSTEALYTRTSVIRGRLDLASGISLLTLRGLEQADYTVEVGVPGLRIGGGGSLGVLARDGRDMFQYGVVIGASVRFRDLVAALVETVRGTSTPAGTYMVAWSPGLDAHLSTYANLVSIDSEDALTRPLSVWTTSFGPQIHVGQVYVVAAMTLAVLREEEYGQYGLDAQALGATFRVGVHGRYASGRTVYAGTSERVDRFAAFHRAERDGRRRERGER